MCDMCDLFGRPSSATGVALCEVISVMSVRVRGGECGSVMWAQAGPHWELVDTATYGDKQHA